MAPIRTIALPCFNYLFTCFFPPERADQRPTSSVGWISISMYPSLFPIVFSPLGSLTDLTSPTDRSCCPWSNSLMVPVAYGAFVICSPYLYPSDLVTFLTSFHASTPAPCDSLNVPDCINLSHCNSSSHLLEHSSHRDVHGCIFHFIQSFAQISPSQRALSQSPFLK